MKNVKSSGVFALLFFVLATGCDSCNYNETGEWIAADTREAIVFQVGGTFETLKFAYDYTPPTTLPGTDITSTEGTQIPGSGKWRPDLNGTYTIDYSKDPAWIDLVATQNGNPRRMQGLIQFLDNNTFYIAIDEVRPATIDNSLRGKVRFSRAAAGELKR